MTTSSEAAFCCCVAMEIWRATRDVSPEAWRSSLMADAAARERSSTRAASLLPSSVATIVARIEPENSSSRLRTDSTDSWERWARWRTSSATTAKRRPSAPAATASMAALSERMCVSWAISVISSRTR
jgi:hypothetical protein